MSSSVFLSNVDDYFAPSQACVNPLFTGSSKKEEEGEKTKETPKMNVVIPRQHRVGARKKRPQQHQQSVNLDESSSVSLSSLPTISIKDAATTNDTMMNMSMKMENTNKDMDIDAINPIVKASIADCLACSGCVTTAETVLLEEKHSLDLLRQRFVTTSVNHNNNNNDMISSSNDNILQNRPMVMTISPAAWADLIRHLDLLHQSSTSNSSTMNDDNDTIPDHQYQQRQMTTLLDQTFTGLALVLDGNVPLQWSLLQAAQEFCQAHSHKQKQHNNSSSNTITINRKHQYPAVTSSSVPSSPSSSLPLISSSCPAVVCLVEKSIHKAVPNLATTKSPMSLAGAFLRQQQYHTKSTSQIYTNNHHQQENSESESFTSVLPPFFHVAVMPCHDKKLEASRPSSAVAAAIGAAASSSFDNMHLPLDTDLVITTSECLQLLQEAHQALLHINTNNDTLDNNDVSSSSLCNILLSCPPAPCITMDNNIENNEEDTQSFMSRLDAAVVAAATASMNTTTTTTKAAATLITVASFLCCPNIATSTSTTASSSSSPFVYGSGGYADYIFRYACRELYGFHVARGVNPWKPVEIGVSAASSSTAAPAMGGRSIRKSVRVAASQQRHRQRDYHQAILYKHKGTGEYSLERLDVDDDYETVLKFAIAYGMQTLQRVLKPFHDDASDTEQPQEQQYDYIEAMACPSGCLNGGGQLPLMTATSQNSKTTTTMTASIAARETPTQTRQRVQLTQSHFLLPSSSPSDENSNTTQPPQTASGPSSSSDVILSRIPMAQRHVTYHAVAPLQLSMGAAAGVAVQDIQW